MHKHFKVTLLLFILICAHPSLSWAVDEKSVKSSFETLINKMIEYGSAGKLIQIKEGTNKGQYIIRKWDDTTKSEIKYDIRKTDSIVSPYIATIVFIAKTCETESATSPDAMSIELYLQRFACRKYDSRIYICISRWKMGVQIIAENLPALTKYNKLFRDLILRVDGLKVTI